SCAHNVLAIAGGTGISYTLPIVIEASRRQMGAVEMIWMVRRTRDVLWILPELLELKARMVNGSAGNLKIRIFVTRDAKPTDVSGSSSPVEEKELGKQDGGLTLTQVAVASSGSSSEDEVLEAIRLQRGFEIEWLRDHHPEVRGGGQQMLDAFLERAASFGGRNMVVASGPAGLGNDLKAVVAKRNDGSRVMKGDESADVEFVWDDRLTL
ncbi:hypothetical protein LTS18_012589, partial [Coniosporium uncinatum]